MRRYGIFYIYNNIPKIILGTIVTIHSKILNTFEKFYYFKNAVKNTELCNILIFKTYII